MSLKIKTSNKNDIYHAKTICHMIKVAAKARETGVAKRNPDYIKNKISQRNAVIALDNNKVVGFCYIESWEDKEYVVNSGLIVHPNYRKTGLARKVKEKIFELSKRKYPNAKIFGITTSLPVMKINSDLGYKPVTFSELTRDERFWDGCKSCVNYDILMRNNRRRCLCTGMIYEPEKEEISSSKGKQKGKKWISLKFLTKNKSK